MLHVAPEESLSAVFRGIDNLDYLSVDLNDPAAMVRMDITNINYPDEHFSVIYCSHVLEHIPDDRKAIAELSRVLHRDGWALIQVPITAERTYEDFSIVDPKERKKHFGQEDHVRRCGPDYVERIRSGGFEVQVLDATDVATDAECATMALEVGAPIFYCRKR
ncbi:MAG TPA: class I SAM-dependent methyltransferase [Burkholderiales bacterium]